MIDSPPDSIVAGQLVHPEEQNPVIARDTGEVPAKPPAAAQGDQPAAGQ